MATGHLGLAQHGVGAHLKADSPGVEAQPRTGSGDSWAQILLEIRAESWVRSQPGAGIRIWDPPSILRHSPSPLTVWSCPHHCLPAHRSMAKATGLGFQGHWLQQPLCKMGCWSSALFPYGSCDQVTDNCPLLLAASELGWAPGRMARLQRAKLGGWSPPKLSTHRPSDQ